MYLANMVVLEYNTSINKMGDLYIYLIRKLEVNQYLYYGKEFKNNMPPKYLKILCKKLLEKTHVGD